MTMLTDEYTRATNEQRKALRELVLGEKGRILQATRGAKCDTKQQQPS